MFYQDLEEPLRFGDVIRGFALSTPSIDSPPLNVNTHEYKIEIALPNFCAVLSPCCSIDEKVISLSPLIQILSSFYLNPHFEEDLTRINRPVSPDKAIPPAGWETLTPLEQKQKMDAGLIYTHWEKFIYEKNDLFPIYTLKKTSSSWEKTTNHYMIDFRNTFRVNCSKIVRPNKAPLGTKCLQLSIETRKELREKISAYYWRIPEEDKVLLANT